jgi:uncharacterized protein with GYD domain
VDPDFIVPDRARMSIAALNLSFTVRDHYNAVGFSQHPHVSWGPVAGHSGVLMTPKETTMAKYVFLVNWTTEGVTSAKDTINRARRAQQGAQSLGGSLELLWTIGRYDLVGLGDFPDDETAAVFSLQVGMQGASRTETLRAFTADEVEGMVSRLG